MIRMRWRSWPAIPSLLVLRGRSALVPWQNPVCFFLIRKSARPATVDPTVLASMCGLERDDQGRVGMSRCRMQPPPTINVLNYSINLHKYDRFHISLVFREMWNTTASSPLTLD